MTENQNEPSNSQGQAKFLSDKPLTADYEQNDRFGHSGIAENLNQIVLTCPVPFTIGLFGKWGTGKTSVLNILKDKLTTDNKVPVVIFDVWKHEGDALRRTFLKEIVEQLQRQNLLKKFELSERVAKSISIKKTVEKIDRLTLGVFLGLVAAMIIIGLFLWQDKSLFNPYFSVTTSGSLVTILLIWLFKRIIVTENITSKADRFEDPHEFEREFFRIIKETHAQRLLIAIDNLDRCTHENAVKLLTTIKTFLAKDSDTEANNKCIFLITCDDEAIKNHLESVYSDSDRKNAFNTDEFLRKFFNAFLVLPNFIDTELQVYTEDLLAETSIPQFDSSDVAHVITTAFYQSPRQIKQFINILIAHFLMAKEREMCLNPLIVPEGTITNNVGLLAKFLVIRQKFPSEYKTITDEYLPFKQWYKIGGPDFHNFLKATKTIATDNIDPFIHLKQSREELNIRFHRDIRIGLIDNNPKLVKAKLASFGVTPTEVGHLYRFIRGLVERNITREATLLNIASCFLEAFEHSKLNLNRHIYVRIGSIINDEDRGLKKNLPEFTPKVIFKELLPKCDEIDRRGIIDQYIAYLSKQKEEYKKGESTVRLEKGGVRSFEIREGYSFELLKELVEHKQWLDKQAKRIIRDFIENTSFNDMEILSLFEEDLENQKAFISGETLRRFVSTFSDIDVEDVESISKKAHLLLKFKGIIDVQTTKRILNKLEELLESENKLSLQQVQEGEPERKENLLNVIEGFLNALADEISKSDVQAELNSFVDKIRRGALALPDWNVRKIFILSCLSLLNLLDDPHKANIDKLIQDFFTNANLNRIQFVFETKKLSKNKRTELIDCYPEIFKKRAISDQSILYYLYPMASKEIRSDWVVDLINSYPNRAVELLGSKEYKPDDNKKVVQALLQKVTTVAVPEKYAIYDTVSKMKCANDKTLKSTLVSQIKSLLKTTDPQNQKVGYHALESASSFLSGPNKRDIATEVIEWLRNLDPASAGQVHSVGSIFLVWNDLADTPRQRDYIDFISDKLIVRGTSLDNIKLGIQTLIKVKPTYENYSKQYDDIFARFETELDENIKIVINGGLVNLKPEKTNKENKAFWDKIHK